MGFKKILQYFGLCALLITSSLGSLLLLERSFLPGVIFGAIILSFILYYLVRLLIKKREETHQEVLSMILLSILYLLIAVFCCYFSLHFITFKAYGKRVSGICK
jgi:predicted PurR-regulated permease PerM